MRAQPLPATPTGDELEAAWREVHAPDWPSLAELQRHMAHYRQVHAAAMRRRQAQPASPPKQSPPAASFAWPPRRARAPSPTGFDAKRLAAGERPEVDDDALPA